MITIIDYGMGNLKSVYMTAGLRLVLIVIISGEIKDIEKNRIKLILPGLNF